jgi:hypothetical protein
VSPTASNAARTSPPAITDTLAGTDPAPGGQYFAQVADGHHRQLPRLTGGPFRYKTYAADTCS